MLLTQWNKAADGVFVISGALSPHAYNLTHFFLGLGGGKEAEAEAASASYRVIWPLFSRVVWRRKPFLKEWVLLRLLREVIRG